MKPKYLVLIISNIIIALIVILILHTKPTNITVSIILNKDMTIPFGSEVYVSDFIASINGTILDNYKIDTYEVGIKDIVFSYVSTEGYNIDYKYEIEVIDNTPPIVWLSDSYSITTDFEGNLANKILCADDTDDYPECYIEGKYDTKKIGKYHLKYIAKDKSGNKKEIPFTLYVNKSTKESSYNPPPLEFSEAIKKYKNANTKIGIDVSSWQGTIDFESIKNSGVEFAIIRVGSKYRETREYFLDSEFISNIQGFNEIGIPVGIYFYSYARDREEAKADAKWVVDLIKDYQIDLPIAYDFEDWNNYNDYHLSLYHLTENANAFLETIEESGYKGTLYSSRSYLTSLWLETKYPIWLAHYTDKTDYEDYTFWQFSASGLVDGIDGYVDLDIMYERGLE